MSERRVHARAELLEQGDALWGYLDALLAEVAPDGEPAVPLNTTVGAAYGRDSSTQAVPEEPQTGGETLVGATPGGGEHAHSTVPQQPEADVSGTERVSSGDEAGVAPAWARPDFQALLFQVGRLKLAVPLLKLHSVVPWTEHISAMPNQPRWCHGMFRYRERNVVVIDTERLVLPDNRQRTDDETAGAEHILIVGDGRWGLACRTVGEVTRLTPEEVKWRSARGRRPWLAGTVLGRLCALMDTEAFSAMLTESRAGAAAD